MRKNRGTTFINIAGLALGIASLLIILIMVRYELIFKRFHSDTDRIYRIVEQFPVDGETYYSSAVAYPLPEAVKTSLASAQQLTACRMKGAHSKLAKLESGNT
ncbi:MAG: ABC transporter permease [Prolixibacteraceae bacterium]